MMTDFRKFLLAGLVAMLGTGSMIYVEAAHANPAAIQITNVAPRSIEAGQCVIEINRDQGKMDASREYHTYSGVSDCAVKGRCAFHERGNVFPRTTASACTYHVKITMPDSPEISIPAGAMVRTREHSAREITAHIYAFSPLRTLP